MFIEGEAGELINLKMVHAVFFRREVDVRSGTYSGKYEVVAETGQREYVLQTVNTRREAIAAIDSISDAVRHSGACIIHMPADIPF